MKLIDEYKCRRCGMIFEISDEARDGWPTLLDDCYHEILARFNMRELTVPQSHLCKGGGYGIGDWVGAREVREPE